LYVNSENIINYRYHLILLAAVGVQLAPDISTMLLPEPMTST